MVNKIENDDSKQLEVTDEIEVIEEKFEPNIFRFVVHHARVYNYNDESYKWRYVIPIKKVYNSWIVLPLFTEKEKFSNMKNYVLIEELSRSKKVYIDLSRQDKILISKENFEKEPYKTNGKLKNIKKSTIKNIQYQQNFYLYKECSIVKNYEKELNRVRPDKTIEREDLFLELE